MKMFNPVRADFAATVDEPLFTSPQGTVVQKGQSLFRVTPDHPPTAHDPASEETRRRQFTLSLLGRL